MPNLFTLPTIEEATAARDTAIMFTEVSAGPEFGRAAREFILNYLREHGPTPGEELVISAKRSGLVPKDDRSFGGAFLSLSKRKLIVKAGTCVRLRGHKTQGGLIWALTP